MAQAQKLAYTPHDTATRVTITPRSKQIRNAKRISRTRINDDFSYLNETPLAQNASNDEIFNAQYQKQGLQPTTGQVQPKKLPVDNNKNYYSKRGTSQNEANNQVVRNALARQDHTKKLALRAKRIKARLRATATNVSVFSWATPLYLTVQLPAAIFSLVTFAIAGSVNAFLNSSNILVSAAAWLAEKAASGVGALFGFDINLIRMADSVFLITYLFVLALGFFTIMIIFLQYTLARLRPLSGEGSGFKIGMLLLAIIGYSLPLLNLFPWVMLWMAAVWKYPR